MSDNLSLDNISWEDFSALSLHEKGVCVNDGGDMFHLLLAQQFSRERLDFLGDLATKIRRLAKDDEGARFLKSLLSVKRSMLYFTQPSTRTFLSFCAACQVLGISTGEVRDRSTSSELKGESSEDSVRTFSSYYDLIIMRSELGGLAERMAWVLSNSDRPVPIINAGSGKDQHPTQALLDIYTLQRSFEKRGGIDGKRIVFVGDLKRGRTVRSLSALLTQYDDVTQCFVAPDQLQINQDVLDQLDQNGVKYELSSDFEPFIADADAIYMTRIQDEWDSSEGESDVIDISRYSIGAKHLDMMKSDGVIMHPLPRRTEISTDVDTDPRAVYWRQMRNGMWVRAALIADVFGKSAEILNYYSQRG